MPADERPTVALLRLQATNACNLNCSYCYIPEESRAGRDSMPEPVLESTLRRLAEEDLLGASLTVSWHGAEPLMAGIAWYETAFAMFDRMLPDVDVTHVFQSNGVLLNHEWCETIASSNIRIGVSLDGPDRNDLTRVNWAGRSSHEAAMRGVSNLNRHGIPWTMLSVITDGTMQDPEGFIDFVRSSGCRELGFKPEETNAANVRHLDAGNEATMRYLDFVQALWKAFPLDGPVHVREFDKYRELKMSSSSRQAHPVTMIPLRNVTVATSGEFTVFSGDLLFQARSEFVFGNVLHDSILGSLNTEKFRRVSDDILAGARLCASVCPFYAVCGSYYLSQKYSEHGTFNASETMACLLGTKTLFTAIDDELSKSTILQMEAPCPGTLQK